MKRVTNWVAVLGAALGLVPGAADAGMLYGISNQAGKVYAIDTGTGQATLVTQITGTGVQAQRFAFGGAEIYNGKLYASGITHTSGKAFGTIDLNTGAVTILGGDSNWWGLAVDAATGRFYTVDSDSAGAGTSFPLKYTDATGSTVTTVGNVTGLPSFTGVSALAHDDTNGILYGLGQQNNVLYRINKSTGAATAVGATGLSHGAGGRAGLAFDQSTGDLFLTNPLSTTPGVVTSPTALYRLNTTTGTATFIANTPDGVEGLAWSATALHGAPVAVPEPASVVSFAFGVVALLGYRLRRRAPATGAESA